jgi:uncharacterized membrane protein
MVRTARVFAWVLAAAVAVRLLCNPAILAYPAGTTPLFNWLLWGYGVPLAAFALAARWARQAEQPSLAEALGWGVLAFAAAFVALELRHYFRASELDGAALAPLREWGAIAIAWMGLGVLALRAARRTPERPRLWGGAGLVTLGATVALVGPGLALDPAWTAESVGALPIANHLLWLYGGPLALLLWAAAASRALPLGRWASRLWSGGALVFTFLLVTLEVRQAFRGALLTAGAASAAENLAYSASWMALGLALLVGGVRGARQRARQAGLGVLLLAVLKVFLYDLSELTGLYRVFSFLGLGACLLILAWLYQRVVARERSAA